MAIDFQDLQYFLGAFNPQPYGRGMSGKQCLSIRTEGDQTVLSLLADVVRKCEDCSDAADLLRLARTNILGRETVIYWPSITIPESED